MMRIKGTEYSAERGEWDALDKWGKAIGVQVLVQHSPDKPHKTWRQCVEEDLTELSMREVEGMDRCNWKCIIDC